MKKKKILALALFAMTAILSLQSVSPCLHYEPEIVELKGIIVRRTIPGPPNYEDMSKGDAPETYWILVLKKPRCVDTQAEDGININEANVKEIQLVFSGNADYERYKNFIGKKVSVSGTLFHAHIGHHHTAVLLMVQNIRLN